jgi:hypothetical protein
MRIQDVAREEKTEDHAPPVRHDALPAGPTGDQHSRPRTINHVVVTKNGARFVDFSSPHKSVKYVRFNLRQSWKRPQLF